MKRSNLRKIIREAVKESITEQTSTTGSCTPADFSPTGYCAQNQLSSLNITSNYWQNWMHTKSNAFFNTGGGYNCNSLHSNWNHLKQQLQNGVNGQGVTWTSQQVTIKKAQINWLTCLIRRCCPN